MQQMCTEPTQSMSTRQPDLESVATEWAALIAGCQLGPLR
jgi:hypothetical protein